MALPRMSGYISARKISKDHNLTTNKEETFNNSQVEIGYDKFKESIFFLFQDVFLVYVKKVVRGEKSKWWLLQFLSTKK